ncbi:MAG: hypothetical protein F6J94_00965 [Moorea sp. SIO1F2]|uniref:hypothetical protein n=1 Tax=Moorena sp. SIO1F2 TaxID=2607819 RepID=UPI0013B6712C|nr:hypothetical protein [Moorena sp. SIO1F2]NET80605.1 hypothetical protein [Moorena sp. SIO1F2]
MTIRVAWPFGQGQSHITDRQMRLIFDHATRTLVRGKQVCGSFDQSTDREI